MLQMKLNRDLPFGPVLAGTGEAAPEDKVCRFYQHGLYFDASGDLLADHPYNKKKVDLIKALGTNDDEKVEPIGNAEREPANPETVAALDALSDDKLFQMAIKLVAINVENGTQDDYEPQESERGDNIRFIAKYTG